MEQLISKKNLLISLLTLTALVGGCARGPISLRFGGDDPQTNLGGGNDNQKLDELVSWEEVSKVVLLNEQGGRCNACHDQDEPPNLTTYNEFKLNLQMIQEEVLVKRSMPKRRKLTEDQYNLVKLWVEQGAPEKGRPFNPDGTTTTTSTTTSTTTTSSTTTSTSPTTTSTTSTTTTTLPEGPGDTTTTTTSTTTSTTTTSSTTTTLPDDNKLISWEEVSQKVFLNQAAGRCNACHDQDEAPNLTTYNEFKADIELINQVVVVERSMPKRRKLTEEQIALVKTWIEQGAPEKGRPFTP